ncbi:hypothetical protein ACIQI8_11060 [Streptomyces sp. NPDC092369]|uniref:hypothetical protein n=1 Tax=Streptomyces sp. NPDC092369 TaxID=3366015 RepID=UPI00380C1BB3
MGIRTLHRRTASAQASTDASPRPTSTPVPVFAADASTARIPAEPALVLGRGLPRAALGAGSGEPSAWRLWAGLLGDHLIRLAGPRPDDSTP